MGKYFEIFGFLILTLGVVFLSVSALLDCPYVIKENYPYTEGIVTKVIDNASSNTIIIQDNESKETIDIHYIHSDYKKGDKVTAYYLPHLKIGTIKKRGDG